MTVVQQPNSFRTGPDERGHFGIYGGRFVAETLMPLILELEEAYAAFGPRRMLWGSDFPPVSGREGYRNALRLPLEQFAARSAEDRELIFGGTALALFPVRG